VLLSSVDDTCYNQSGTLCRWVYEQTDQNETVANLANWFVDRPLQILLVVVIALVATRVAKRWVARLARRLLAPESDAGTHLQKVGIEMPDSLSSAPDPRRESRAASVSLVLTSTIIVVIWVIALLTILGIVGVQLAPLLAGAGIAGVALGFGAQSLVKDCIAGLFMLLEDQYGIGDVVDLGEAVGVVEEVSLRTTVLRGIDGTVWHVPNGVVQRVGNLSQLWSVALVDIDVAYDTEIERARHLLQRAADEVCARNELAATIVEQPKVLGVEALGADGITLRLIVKVEPGTQWVLQRALREHVKAVFDESAIEIPFPQRTVWMRTESSDQSPAGS
jgi:small-conductance mechanosensitive channel